MTHGKTRYFIFLSYKGTSYFGWQVQPGKMTVQQTLDKALSLKLGEDVKTTGAGRTDTGVHASFFCAHFESSDPGLADNERLLFSLNGLLPKEIAASKIRKVRPDAHARFSALSRSYRYIIAREKNPFEHETSWYLYGDIDFSAMNQACDKLRMHTDFTSFCKLHSDNLTNICHIYEARWKEEGSKLIFEIKADRFLRNMVRAIVGTMLEVGFGKMSPDEFEHVISAADRQRAGQSAPARGLFLSSIEYPPDLFIAQA